MNKTYVLLSLIILNSSLFITELMAQAPPPSSNPPGAPIDTLVGVLLAAGVGYGVKRFKQKP